MSEKDNILNQLKLRKKPEVPDGFFDSLSDQLLSSLSEDTSMLDDLKPLKQPEVPADFFASFPEKMSALVKDSPKRGRIIPMGIWATLTSAAAILAVILWMNQDEQTIILSDNKTEVSQENSLDDEDYDAYLTYVDEGEIVDFIIENEISLDSDDGTTSLEDDIYDYVDDDIEDYYLEL